MIELLAPAGDEQSFEKAISSGANAVYLGLKDFNARQKAANFDCAALKRIVREAHFNGVKVYVTLNTLIKDDEFPALFNLVKLAVDCKVDAFIVQDLGVASILQKKFKGIVLHASTQLGVHNLQGAIEAEKFGFKRVVLSRETKIEDIREIRANTSLEIEFFVQGALCIAFSGNCYMSALEQHASGNRGLCKQMCRLPYCVNSNGEEHENYAFSAKDMCLATELKRLHEAGVTSFKIEGRMRRSDYVETAVKVYRTLIDNLEKNKATKISDEDKERLKIAYSRGDSYLDKAYLDGVPLVVEKEYNNHTGILIGKVLKVKPFKDGLNEITVSSERVIEDGSGLKFFNKDTHKETASLGVGGVRKVGKNYMFVSKNKVSATDDVRLISLPETKSAPNGVFVDFRVECLTNEPIKLTATARKMSVTVKGEVCEPAISHPTEGSEVVSLVSRTLGSGFIPRSCDVITDGVFLLKSTVTSLRREALEKLKEKLIEDFEKDNLVEYDEATLYDVSDDFYDEEKEALRVCEEYQEKEKERLLRAYENELRREKGLKAKRVEEDEDGAEIESVYKSVKFVHYFDKIEKGKSDVLYVLCPENYRLDEVRDMMRRLNVDASNVALQLPVILNGKDREVLEKLLVGLTEIKTLVSENIYGLSYVDRDYIVLAGAGHNVFNGYAKKRLLSRGVKRVLPSIELSKRRGVEGTELPLMTFAHCPIKTQFGNSCSDCKYNKPLEVRRENKSYRIYRTRLANCYFGLYKI